MMLLSEMWQIISSSWLQILLVIAVAAVGSFIQRVSGFGFGIFVMIFLPYIISDYGPATVLSSMMGLVLSLQVSVTKRKHINWRLVLPCLATAMITTVLSVIFMTKQSGSTLKLLLGIVLILLSVYFIFFSKRLKVSGNIPTGLGVGLLSGVMSGLFAMSGPPVVVYMLSAAATATEYIATIQAYFAALSVFTIGTKIVAGFFTVQVFVFFVFGAIGVVVGNIVGSRVFDKLNTDMIKRIAYIVMAVSGVVTMLSALGVI